MKTPAIDRSRALWNRTGADLRSNEVLAQLLDRGEMDAWRELYALAREDRELRQRIHRVVLMTPLPLPRFWLAALSTLGEPVDLHAPLLPYDSGV